MSWLHGLILAGTLGWQAGSNGSVDGSKDGAHAPASLTARKADGGKPGERNGKAAAPEASKDRDAKDRANPTSKPAKAAKPAARKLGGGPQVLSRSEMQKARSPFLEMPGASPAPVDRYSPETTDWRDVPPWRQTSFFGLRAQGQFFVYVIDCSESMIDEDRFARATMEVRRSVLALKPPQQFEVIFFNEESMPMPGGPRPRSADTQGKGQLLTWLRIVEPDGGTDPRAALRQALSLRPSAIFLLSDGALPDGTVEAVTHSNTHRIPIHCVDMSGGEGGNHLQRIARNSGGQYAIREGSLQGKR
ncbi:MAG: vWA domain-containing protein [Isosphaeraceae bacterium]